MVTRTCWYVDKNKEFTLFIGETDPIRSVYQIGAGKTKVHIRAEDPNLVDRTFIWAPTVDDYDTERYQRVYNDYVGNKLYSLLERLRV